MRWRLFTIMFMLLSLLCFAIYNLAPADDNFPTNETTDIIYMQLSVYLEMEELIKKQQEMLRNCTIYARRCTEEYKKLNKTRNKCKAL